MYKLMVVLVVVLAGCSAPTPTDYPARDATEFERSFFSYMTGGAWGEFRLRAGDVPIELCSSLDTQLGVIYFVREGDVLTIRARANDPFEEPHGFEADALMLDWELPDELDVAGVEFGWPVSTWARTGWRQYTSEGKNRLVLAAAAGTNGEAYHTLAEWGVPELRDDIVFITPGQHYTFARIELAGDGVPVPHHPLADFGLVDGFAGYDFGNRVDFVVLGRRYTAEPWVAGGGRVVPANQLDAFGLDWFHSPSWQPLDVIWTDTWGQDWGDGLGDGWMHSAVLYPNAYVRHSGGRAGAIHPPGDWIWTDHFEPDTWVEFFRVQYVAGVVGPPPQLAAGPYAGHNTWGPSADFEGADVCLFSWEVEDDGL